MPGMLVTQPVGHFPELGAFFLWDWRVMLTGEDQTCRVPLWIAGHGAGWTLP